MLRRLLLPEVSPELTLKQQLQSQVPQLFPALRGVVTVLVVCLGTLFFGQVGSLAYPENGVGAIVGCSIGVTLCLVLGCCATGSWRDVLQGPEGAQAGLLLPHALAAHVGGHGHFDLIVTVHRVVGVQVQGQMPWSPVHVYAEVECGENPVKRTCVRPDGRFEEQFKLHVQAMDSTILVRLKSQGVFGTVDVGYVHIDIQSDIVDAGSLREKVFEIEAGEGDTLRWTKPRAYLTLSFDLGGAESAARRAASPFDTHKDPGGHSSSHVKYGAVDFISRLEFNTDARMESRDDATLKK